MYKRANVLARVCVSPHIQIHIVYRRGNILQIYLINIGDLQTLVIKKLYDKLYVVRKPYLITVLKIASTLYRILYRIFEILRISEIRGNIIHL